MRTLVETGVLVGERRGLSPGQAAGEPAGPGHGTGGAGGAHRPAATRGETPAPDRCGHWHRGALCRCCRPLPTLPEEALYRSLAHLQAAEFLYETSLFPERAYTFKHALTHEVAYGSLLLERRRVLHARIVEALEVARCRPAGRPSRPAGAPCPAGRGVGQGRRLLRQAGARARDRARSARR